MRALQPSKACAAGTAARRHPQAQHHRPHTTTCPTFTANSPALLARTHVKTMEYTAALPAWTSDVHRESVQRWLGIGDVHQLSLTNCKELEQSECCQMDVESTSQGKLQLLLKRYHLRRLMQRIPKPESKWRISAQSFTNEFNFLAAREHLAQLHAFLQPSAGVPKVYYAQGQVSDTDWFDRQYDFIFELLPSSQFHQSSQLNLEEARAALTLLARWHAFFWHPTTQPRATDSTHTQHTDSCTGTAATHSAGTSIQHSGAAHTTTDSIPSQQSVAPGGGGCQQPSGAAQQQWSGVFPRGGWWRKPLRPSVKYERIPDAWSGLCQAFPGPELFGGDLGGESARQLMVALRDSVDDITEALAAAPDRTLVHGDPKTSNLFFKASAGGHQDSLQAYAIDFQWVGRGASGLGDVVYCLYGGVQYTVVAAHEQELLEWYYSQFHSALRDRGLDPHKEAHRAWLDAHLVMETLAYWATALPQLLEGLTPDVCAENLGKYGWLTHEMDARCTAWLARKAVECMKTVQAAGGAAQLLSSVQ